MDWESIWQSILNWLTHTGIKILIAIVLMIVSFAIINWIAKKSKKIEESKHVDTTLYRTLSYVIKVGLKILVVVSLIAYLGIDTSAITALVASFGVGVGLAVNGTLSNFAGGVMLLFTRPLRDGGFISPSIHYIRSFGFI